MFYLKPLEKPQGKIVKFIFHKYIIIKQFMKSDIVYYDSIVQTINLLNENLYKFRLLVLLSNASDNDQFLDLLEKIKIECEF